MKLKLLLITWLDSRRSLDEYSTEDNDMALFPLATIESIGWGKVLKDRIVLAVEHYPEIKGIQVEQVRGLYSFPRSCVVDVKELKI